MDSVKTQISEFSSELVIQAAKLHFHFQSDMEHPTNEF